MHQTNPINPNDLPSTLSLIKATLAAFIVAAIILVCIVLPAEFAIDITGIGKRLGLQEMGDIKVSLAREQQADALVQETRPVETKLKSNVQPSPLNEQIAAVEQTSITSISATQRKTVEVTKLISLASDSRAFILKNGEAAELKVALNKGEFVNFNWRSNAKVNFDNHGDSNTISYHPYSKGKGVNQDSGRIKAAFDGYHGWFWRNRSGNSVTINIDFNGQYHDIKRIK